VNKKTDKKPAIDKDLNIEAKQEEQWYNLFQRQAESSNTRSIDQDLNLLY
jgi:hypothetical protein